MKAVVVVVAAVLACWCVAAATTITRTGSTNNEDCTGAITDLMMLAAEGCFNFPSFTDGASLETIVPQICNTAPGNCSIANMEALVEVVLTECDLEAFVPDEIDQLLEAIQLVCLQVDGTYCMPKVWETMTHVADLANVDASVLEMFCDPCVYEFWRNAIQFASEDQIMELYPYVIACMKDGDAWCYLEYQQEVAALAKEDFVGAGQIACRTQCVNRVVQYLNKFDSSFTLPEDILCYQDAEGNLCIPTAVQAVADYDLVENCVQIDGDMTQAEETACVASIIQVINATDCCFTTALNFVADAISSEGYDTVTTVMKEHGITPPDACKPTKTVKIAINIDNLLESWLTADDNHLTEFLNWLTTDFSLNVGIDGSAVTVSYDTARRRTTTTSVPFEATVNVQSDSQAETVTSAFNYMVAHDSFSLYATASNTNYDAYVDKTESLSVAPTSQATANVVNLDSNDNAGAATAVFAALPLVALLAALY
eukprot:TRINITY_DN40_c0_g3_i3.p1 TRINITY_DN40_c0_g3~~TRINITY_DN40_c0_g3_i3.p1  ORF type:complete len:484 (-),score=169.14 TRINITY_DN40_c0_g3_i3:2384-3835(-)